MCDDLISTAKPKAKILVFPASGLVRVNDNALVRALSSGDTRAPRVIWQRFSGLVYRLLRRALGQMRDCESLAQEVFLNLFRKAVMHDEPGSLPGLVTQLTVQTARRELRRRRLRRWLRLGIDRDTTKGMLGTLPNWEECRALVDFYDVLNKLNTKDRMAFVLRYLEGMELCEVAAALDLSAATIGKRVGRVRARIEQLAGRDPVLADYRSNLATGEER